MPELPEVQYTRKLLERVLLKPIAKKIKNIIFHNEEVVKQIEVQDFKSKVIGEQFTQIGRYGKFLFLKLQNYSIISHLKLQGRYTFNQNGCQDSSKIKFCRFEIQLNDQSSLIYTDSIKLGTLHLVNKGQEMSHRLVNKLGPEVNSEKFTQNYFKKKCGQRKISIKQVLLNQNIVSGIGNKWADEILYKAQIHPETIANSLKQEQIKDIVEISKAVIEEAVEKSSRVKLNAYNQDGHKCRKCSRVISKIKVGQRSAHFCPVCQIKDATL